MAKPRLNAGRTAIKRTGKLNVSQKSGPAKRESGAADDRTIPPIFLHSSFRSGSTWLWSKFHEEPSFYVYYEIYNEALAKLDLATIGHSGHDWYSNHPIDAPYFLEFAPLLSEVAGVRNYNSAMAFAEFFPQATAREDDRFLPQRDYVGLLIRNAYQARRVPVLTCTRSLARIGWLKRTFGGLHLSLRRNLLHQWLSYSNQALNGNSYFIGTVIHTILGNTDDPVIAVLRRFIGDNKIPLATDPLLQPNDNLFVCFIVLHIYLDFLGERDSDVVINLADLADPGMGSARESLSATVRQHSGRNIEFADAREVISAPMMLFADPKRIDLTVKSIFLMLRQAASSDATTFAHLAEVASQRMATLWQEYDRYCHFSASAHTEINRLRKTLSPNPCGAAPIMADERAAFAASLRNATDYAESLFASRNDMATHLDAARAEVAAASNRVETLDAARKQLEGERDAALRRLTEAEAAMQQDRLALKTALDDACAYAASLKASCGELTAQCDTARAEAAAAANRAETLDAAREQLEGERDAALRRLTDAEAAMQQERLALKTALDDACAYAASLKASCDELTAHRDTARAEAAAAFNRAETLDAARKQLQGERDAALRRLTEAAAAMQQERLALKTALDDARAYAASLKASCDELIADRDTARAEAAAASNRAETLDAAREQLEGERDAALRRLTEAEAAMQQERLALKTTLDDARAYAASLKASCDELIADRDTARAEAAAASNRAETLDAAREQLEGERDAALRRLTEAEAAMEQDRLALKTALDVRIFHDPAEADIFASRWKKMISKLE